MPSAQQLATVGTGSRYRSMHRARACCMGPRISTPHSRSMERSVQSGPDASRRLLRCCVGPCPSAPRRTASQPPPPVMLRQCSHARTCPRKRPARCGNYPAPRAPRPAATAVPWEAARSSGAWPTPGHVQHRYSAPGPMPSTKRPRDIGPQKAELSVRRGLF